MSDPGLPVTVAAPHDRAEKERDDLRAQLEQERRLTEEAQTVAREIAMESGFDGSTRWEWWTDQYPWLNERG